MASLEKLDNNTAIQLWDDLALKNVDDPNLALNPYLFDFFRSYLKLLPFYIILYNGEKPIGLFPLVFDGSKYCSLPHLSYGGIFWIKSETPRESTENIFSQIVSIIDKQNLIPGFFRINVESIDDNTINLSADLEIRSHDSYFAKKETNKSIQFISLKSTFEEQSKLFNSNLRRKISKAAKNGIIVKKGGANLIPDFTKVYNRNIQSIGSPTLGKTFFSTLANIKEANVEVFVAYLENLPIGGGFCMWYDRYYENTWFSTLSKYNNLYTSYLLHAEMIKSAILKKANTYSLGRSTKDSGVHQYKMQWPVSEKDLYFSRTLAPGFSLKDQKWMSSVWKHLPGFFVDAVGPWFAKRMY